MFIILYNYMNINKFLPLGEHSKVQKPGFICRRGFLHTPKYLSLSGIHLSSPVSIIYFQK
jgi:hypothetical protein